MRNVLCPDTTPILQCILFVLIILAIIGCGKKEYIPIQSPTVEGVHDAMYETIMRDQDGHNYSPAMLYAVFFELNQDGVPRAFTTYPMRMGKGGHIWDPYYYKDGRWQLGPAWIDDKNDNHVYARENDFYILTEEGEKPKFIVVADYGYDGIDNSYIAQREAYHISIDSKGYLEKIPMPEFSFRETSFKFDGVDIIDYPELKPQTPNGKLERIQVQTLNIEE